MVDSSEMDRFSLSNRTNGLLELPTLFSGRSRVLGICTVQGMCQVYFFTGASKNQQAEANLLYFKKILPIFGVDQRFVIFVSVLCASRSKLEV